MREGDNQEMVERRASPILIQQADEFLQWQNFYAERLDTEPVRAWIAQKMPKNLKLQKRGKTLNYNKETTKVQSELDKTRAAEWEKWQKHDAVRVLSHEEARKLREQGAEEIGTQWIETDKNEHLRLPGGPLVDPLYKSRLVARGDQEKGEIRSDSTTCDIPGQNLIFPLASPHPPL